MDKLSALFLYLRAAEELAEVSASRKLDDANVLAAQAMLSAAQKAFWKAEDAPAR